MIRIRFRIHFSKEGDLRLISHRDLVRTFERLFRRAQLQLSMSEGFHPKARMSFPSALGLGIEGLDEVMDLELAEEIAEEHVAERLTRHAPPGLVIHRVYRLNEHQRKAQVRAAEYRFPVPDERRSQVQASVEALLATSTYRVEREGRSPIDLRAEIEDLRLNDDNLVIRLRVSPSGSARAREVLEALELADLEQLQGYYLTRTAVELLP